MKEAFDTDLIKKVYSSFPERVNSASRVLKRALTLSEKILYAHLPEGTEIKDFIRGTDYLNFNPDRVAMQDATAQMALLQFMNAQRENASVPVTVHCDHLIIAEVEARHDIVTASVTNREVYDFLRTVCSKYGMTFWEPGSGIIHQVVLENYAFPGGMIIGTDSHTPNAGGLGMIAIGVGGADAVDVMAGIPWELKMPKLIGVKLSGRLNGWASPKDVILKLAGILTVKGATNAILEYFGEGTASLSATGKATICNMGAEVGATASLFPYDSKMYDYLKSTGRKSVAEMAQEIKECLIADKEVMSNPEKYYDRVIEIDLSTLEPYINGPFTPDAANTISEFVKTIKEKGYPEKVEAGLIGSCTNSSYGDMGRAASLARQAIKKNLEVKSELIINPGSEKVRLTAERDGLLDDLKRIGGVMMANACGPCIGQWKRKNASEGLPNSIVTSFNRNFAKRNDGNPNTYAFVASPELTMALSIAGTLCFNPLTDTLTNRDGKAVRLDPPTGNEYPHGGFASNVNCFVLPSTDPASVKVAVNPESERLQLLQPFEPWDGNDFENLPLLIKVSGKCTTDHISMAGPWLRYRGHLGNISENMLMGAINAFSGKTDHVLNSVTGSYDRVSAVARQYKENNTGSVVVAEENYGEGSSREHAAMEPRFLNVKVILAKSFARIHETNLKKQGVLALTFADKKDYLKIREDDKITVTGLKSFAPGRNMTVMLNHSDGTVEAFGAVHTYNDLQIKWFRKGSALNNRV
jgi:aconitate hydratase